MHKYFYAETHIKNAEMLKYLGIFRDRLSKNYQPATAAPLKFFSAAALTASL